MDDRTRIEDLELTDAEVDRPPRSTTCYPGHCTMPVQTHCGDADSLAEAVTDGEAE